MKKHQVLFFVLLAIFSSTCRKPNLDDIIKPVTPTELSYPSYFPKADIPADNPLSVEGILLGRKLYYDPMLSQGGPQNGFACGSCHHQKNGFMIPSKPFEDFGIVMPHVNLAWNKNFLWNGKVRGSLEDIMLFEVKDFFATDLTLFNQHHEYKKIVKQVYGKDEITYKELSYALAQWFRSLISQDSKFDKYLKKEIQLNPSELRGFVIFNSEKGDCFHCHGLPMFTDNDFHNTGLESTFIGNNMGLYNNTANPYDLGKFKTPTLRNAAFRKVYMHDGRFKSLEEVIEFYNSGVKHSPTLDPIMTKPGKEYGLELSAQDKADLLAFLLTLSDSTFITNQAFGKP
jgi:cytochrome c peroxidase